MGQIVNREDSGRWELLSVPRGSLLLTKQEKPAWGSNVVVTEQGNREDAPCLQIKTKGYIIRGTS